MSQPDILLVLCGRCGVFHGLSKGDAGIVGRQTLRERQRSARGSEHGLQAIGQAPVLHHAPGGADGRDRVLRAHRIGDGQRRQRQGLVKQGRTRAHRARVIQQRDEQGRPVGAQHAIFSGRQWHSANYPGPEPFRGTKVAVVGAANSGAQIAAELTDVADVTWYTRHEPRWMPDDVDGRVLFRRNSLRALAILRGEEDPGADSELGDIVVLPAVKKARDEGRLVATPLFASLDDIDADHLIWCTGFRPAIRPFRKLLDRGLPLHLVGYGDWVGPGSATITGVGPYAKKAAEAVARYR